MRSSTSIFILLISLCLSSFASAQDSLDKKIDQWFGSVTKPYVDLIFTNINFSDQFSAPAVVFWLAFAGFLFTIIFKFINLRAFGLALRTVKGKYSSPNDPGEVTHFQALSAAVSGTVGLGNIAGVAIGIHSGGPGVAFWLMLSGFLGMSTKFAECTLGVKFREISPNGEVHGGPMYYLRYGLAQKNLKNLGIFLAALFAFFCVLASFGGGNLFQVNQVTSQLISVTGGTSSFFAEKQWLFGTILASLTALVILGGIQSIAKVTDKLVPLMCLCYVIGCIAVILNNFGHLPETINMILTEAFQPRAVVTGSFLGAFIWGMRRASFSNEAGIGSSPIAHAAAKTRKPASEGIVALLEPFIDTVVVCTLTAIMLCISMHFDGDSGNFAINGQNFTLGIKDGDNNQFGIRMTSLAFETVHPSFKYLLFVCVALFAFSTLITWSYYGLKAWQYLFGKNRWVATTYKLIFCLIIIVGSSSSMEKAVDFSDASLFAMSIPNLIGVIILVSIVQKELRSYIAFTKLVDAGKSIEEADQATQKSIPQL